MEPQGGEARSSFKLRKFSRVFTEERLLSFLGRFADDAAVLNSSPPPVRSHSTDGVLKPYYFAQEIADSGQPPKTVIELSTLTLADKLRFESILRKAGHIALDCPLSGTGAQAKIRDLVVYASGDAKAISECMGLFADFAKQSADLGRYGNGSRMKFIANHLVAINNVATAEAMLLAERAGLDAKTVVEMVGPGAGGSRMFQMRAPMMVDRVYETRNDESFDVEKGHGDYRRVCRRCRV